MSEPSIAQQIANKRLYRRKLVKLAQGHQPQPRLGGAPVSDASGSAKPRSAGGGYVSPSSSRGSAQAVRQHQAAKPLPTAPRRGHVSPTAAAAQATRQHQAAKPRQIQSVGDDPVAEIGGAFFSGMGEGVGNMFGAVGDFGRGSARLLAAPFAAEIGRAMHSDSAAGDAYANDMYRHYEKAWSDVGNSFGRYIGVYDGRAPSLAGLRDQVNFISGPQYRPAQPADATKQHVQEIGEKYFGDTTATPIGRAYNTTNRVADGLSESIPLAASGGALGRSLGSAVTSRVPHVPYMSSLAASKMPAASPAVRTAIKYGPPVVRNAVTYGLGIPVNASARTLAGRAAAGLGFLASNIGQNTVGGLIETAPQAVASLDEQIEQMSSAGFQGTPEFERLVQQRAQWDIGARLNRLGASQFLPAYRLDQGIRSVAGEYAPEIGDAALRANSPAAATAGLLFQLGFPETLNYQNEAQAHANAQQAQAQAQNMQQTLDQHNNLVTQIIDAENAGVSAQLDGASRAQYDALLQSLESQNTPDQLATMQQMSRILNGEAAAQPIENQPGTAATTEAPQPNLTEGQPVAQIDPAAVSTAVQEAMPADATPDQLQAADEAAATIANDPNKPQTPEDAAALVENSEGSSIERLAQERAQENPPPTDNPRDWGQWFEETMSWATDAWNNLGFVGQLAFGLGMPLGVIGLLGGGLSGVLTAALGFGVAGLAAAGSGAFGETAQGAVTSAGETAAAAGEAVTGTGPLVAPVAPPPAANPETALLYQIGATPLTGKNGLQSVLDANRDTLTGLLAKTDAEIKQIYAGLPPELQKTLENKLNAAWWGPRTGQVVDDPNTPDNEVKKVKETIDRLLGIIKKGQHMQYLNNKSASHIVAQHFAIAAMQKAARCWSGYEPVPGKKPYSNDSCRPIGGKKKKKKDKAAK